MSDVSRETRRGEIRSDSERPDGHPESRSFAPPLPTEPQAGSAGAPLNGSGAPSEKPTPPEKNKRSSVYVYLVILFGAAFLMLLLAYFVQIRNSETAYSDLRNSMNLSREQLMEENRTLEEEKQALQEELDELAAQLAELQADFDQAKIQLDTYMEIAGKVTVTEQENLCWLELWSLEEAFLKKDYETCAEAFRLWYGSNYYMTPDAARWRAEEIYNKLIRLGYLDEAENARW